MVFGKKTYDMGQVLNALESEFGADDSDLEVIPDNLEPQEPEQKEEVKEQPKQEEVKEPVAQPAEAESKPWESEIQNLQVQLDYFRGLAEKQSQPAPQPVQVPQQEDRKPLREIVDGDEYAARMEEMEKQALQAAAAIRMMEKQNLLRQLDEVAKDYPELKQLLPPDQIEVAITHRLHAGNIGGDYKQQLMQVYDLATNNKRFAGKDQRIQELESELARLKDEVAAKREAKQTQDVKTAGAVPAGGQVFQDPGISVNPLKVTAQNRGVRSYDAAAKAFHQALAQ